MKFLHAADLHLDSPLRGLDRYEGVPVDRFRGATRAALQNLVDLCMAEQVDFVLLVGDLYDGNWKDFRTGLFFVSQMTRLRDAGIPVLVVRGNHDAESALTRSLRLPSNVVLLSTRAPQTDAATLERLGVVIHGQGYASRAVTQDLARSYPDAVPGHFNIGMLHTSVDGREGHASYAPCSVETLRSKGYDYWALGHVHEREVLCDDPWIVFPGNLQGRHAREAGPKGATLVTVDAGRVTRVEARTLDVVRWTCCRVDLAAAAGADDAVDLVRRALAQALEEAEGRPLAARVELVGQTQAHAALHADPERWIAEIRNVALQAGDGVWVEKVHLRTSTCLDLAALARRDDAVGLLVRGLDASASDAELPGQLVEALADIRARLPRELREGDEALRLDDPEYLRALIPEAAQIVLGRVLERADR